METKKKIPNPRTPTSVRADKPKHPAATAAGPKSPAAEAPVVAKRRAKARESVDEQADKLAAERAQPAAPSLPPLETADDVLRELWARCAVAGQTASFDVWLGNLRKCVEAMRAGDETVVTAIDGGLYHQDEDGRIPVVKYVDVLLGDVPTPKSLMQWQKWERSWERYRAEQRRAKEREAKADRQGDTEIFENIRIPAGSVNYRGHYCHCRSWDEIMAQGRELGIPAEVFDRERFSLRGKLPYQLIYQRVYKRAEKLIVQVQQAVDKGKDPAPLWKRWLPAAKAPGR